MNVGKPSNPSRRGLELKHAVGVLALSGLLSVSQVQAGAACVVAKRLGDSLAIEWVAGVEQNAAIAIEQAQQRLVERGYRNKGQDVHAQASTELPHAHLVIVKTRYTTATGRARTSYGCGYSPRSTADAEHAAVYDLRNYSWGWRPEYGYEVIERTRF